MLLVSLSHLGLSICNTLMREKESWHITLSFRPEHPHRSLMSLSSVDRLESYYILLVIETSNYCDQNQLQHEMELQIGVVEEMHNDT